MSIGTFYSSIRPMTAIIYAGIARRRKEEQI